MMASLRARLLLGTVGGMVLLLTGLGLILYGTIRRALLNEFDRSLASTVEILAAGVEVDRGQIDVDFEVEQMPQFNDPECPALYQIWQLGSGVIARSPLLGTSDLPRFYGEPGVSVHRAMRDPRRGLPLRAVGVRFSPRVEGEQAVAMAETLPRGPLVMVVARDARTLLRQLNSLKWLLLAVTGGTVGLTLLAGGLAVQRGLRPLRSMAAEIAAVDENSLDAHVGGRSTPAELVPVRDRLNDLLTRLKEAFERERRFSANVAHELRNPLAGIRSTIDVTLTRERDVAEYRQSLSECRAIVDGMQVMVGNLLLLARMEADQMAFHAEEVNLDKVVDSAWRPFAKAAAERGLVFRSSIPTDLALSCDRQSLLAVLSNLFSNAVEYAEDGGRVWIQAEAGDASVELAVANTGCRLRLDEVARVCDRFWRADPARSEAGAHCGLGLSLVRRIVEAQGGSIHVGVDEGTFTFRFALPRSVHGKSQKCEGPALNPCSGPSDMEDTPEQRSE